MDEAYQPFSSSRSMAALTGRFNNLLVLRTLSKVGLAGLRVGYLIGNSALIKEVNKVRLPFNLNALSQATAVNILEKDRKLKSSITSIIAERDRLFKAISGIGGIKPFPSEANFILFEVKDPRRIYRGLLKKGILVRDLSSTVKGCLRVTIGTRSENKAFIKALRELSI